MKEDISGKGDSDPLTPPIRATGVYTHCVYYAKFSK